MEKLVHPADLPTFRAGCARAVASKSPFRLEYRVFASGRHSSLLPGQRYPLIDSEGNISSIVGLRVDITARKRDEEQIRQMNSELERRVSDGPRNYNLPTRRWRHFATPFLTTFERAAQHPGLQRDCPSGIRRENWTVAARNI